VSPSARKHAGGVHHDEKEYPTLKHGEAKAESHEPVIMKDSEGTEQNVAGSLALSEKTDVPKAGDSVSPGQLLLFYSTEAVNIIVCIVRGDQGRGQDRYHHRYLLLGLC
jgi:hypothetical protein